MYLKTPMKLSTTLITLINLLAVHQCLKQCDPSYCNHEGQCSIDGNNKICKCIGKQYFKGTRCLEKIDNCLGNPCQNGALCHNLVGQFICRNCNRNFGGQRCDVPLRNVFENMVLFFNHYGYYSKKQDFLLLVEDLGAVPFSVEFVADNYVIDSFECNPQKNKLQWTYSSDLPELIRNHGTHYYNDLPFTKGFYRLCHETFWDVSRLSLTLSVYDAETASELLHYQTFDLLIKNLDSMKCVSQLQFPHGSNPLEPLQLDIARFNNFKPLIVHRCMEDSEVMYKWSVFNSIGSMKLYNFGETEIPLLKVPPYRLWFNYHGVVMSSYSLVLTMIERWGSFRAITERRCFILILPKPVKATIKGGIQRELGFGQSLLLDGSESRDFALPSPSQHEISYNWTCKSVDDPRNSACNTSLSTRIAVLIQPHQLKINATYQYSLTIHSKVNIFVRDTAVQSILVVEHPRLSIHIQCVRNCLRNQFTSDSSIHLKVECIVKEDCMGNSTFQWEVDGRIHGSGQHLIYMPKTDDSYIMVKAEVWHKGWEGMCSLALAKNKPPSGGQCFIDPQSGIAFHTEFRIHCDEWQDIDVPLIYHYMADEFPLEIINDPDIYFRLPECERVKVAICDQFDACAEKILLVNVSPLEKPESFASFFSKGNLLDNGDRLTAMVLLKSLTSSIHNEAEILEIMVSLENFNILTLLEMQQWLYICKDFLNKMLPLDNRKSFAMLVYFKKLHLGLEFIRNDKEMQDISKKSYEHALRHISHILTEYANPWEIIPEINAKPQQQISANDPLAEDYKDLSEFDIHILEKIANWLDPTRVLYKCFETLSSHSSNVYFPTEIVTIMEDGEYVMEINTVDNAVAKEYTSAIANQAVDIRLSGDIIFLTNSISLQMTSLKSNLFWWYPDEQPLSMEVFAINAFSIITAKLTQSLAFKLPSMELAIFPQAREILVSIRSHLHMPTYILQLSPNAAINVTITKADERVFLEIFFGKRPRSFLVRKSNRSSIFAINRSDQSKIIYIAVLAENDINKFPLFLSIRVNIIECLYWNWDAQDPQWSSKGCRPKTTDNTMSELKCECDHLSAFAARFYDNLPYEDLKDNQLLESLPFNWILVTFYTLLLAVFDGLVYYNIYRSKLSNGFLMSSVSNTADYDVEVQIFTGSHWSAGSTANVHFRFISARGPYSVTIYQNPRNPQLVCNSRCKFRLSSGHIQMPCKLTINHDHTGRYPSWFCHKIFVVNLQTTQSQLFRINQWVTKQPLEVLASSESWSFRENLLNYYIHWFQFQPIWGPRKFTDLCAVRRCHIWIAQTMVSLCIVACYYGPTTMESYEEERELYNSLNLTLTELLVLPFVCFLSSLAVKFIFTSLLFR